ncbi:hypothetical protein B046DRAFT_06919 [Streptomyces sp. LamerLS-316]|uniref:hypothetical protein n=1 Tax=unclassified Streptomyces TaxID=2593676 RepID=UPI000823AB1B|nr:MULTISPECIES: hypothetical protein [unclassified Streptomyces]MYQ42563.1 hypothetical protein [Streptomyces sp. SID4921]SCK25255.1 hypothetical protein B046DRAFT_06919 [Streptomyces sp. LamerLS-316]
MTYRRAAIPALAGGLLLTALLWWAGASADALHLQGATNTLGGRLVADLQSWLSPWSYDPPDSVRFGTGVLGDIGDPASADPGRYLSLHRTGMQIRFAAVFAFFVPGALLLVRRLPPVNRRMTVALAAVWAWGMVAGMLASAVSAPWLIASTGRGSYRFLPQLAGMASSGQQIVAVAALVTAVVTVLAARVTAKGAGPLPLGAVPVRAARLAATAGTAVVAVSLVILSYQSVAASIQTVSLSGRLLSEPGDLLRAWLLLGGWNAPTDGFLGHWLLYRLADALMLAVVWWALRLLPVLLTRATVPAMAVGGVCATVVGLLAAQLFQFAVTGADAGLRWGWQYLTGALGGHVPAALTWGLLAGLTTVVTLRLAGGRVESTGPVPTELTTPA